MVAIYNRNRKTVKKMEKNCPITDEKKGA